MPSERFNHRLGDILHEAGLISPSQLEIALYEQGAYQDLKIGEILALHGWLKQETADFFAEQWLQALQGGQRRHPLGYFLLAAGLLEEPQLTQILREQLQTGMRLGALAVLQGWVKQPTIDFFLKHLAPTELNVSPFKRYTGASAQSTSPRATSSDFNSDLIWTPPASPKFAPREPKPSDEDEVRWVG